MCQKKEKEKDNKKQSGGKFLKRVCERDWAQGPNY